MRSPGQSNLHGALALELLLSHKRQLVLLVSGLWLPGQRVRYPCQTAVGAPHHHASKTPAFELQDSEYTFVPG